MKNNRGISVLALVITVVVIVIIASITIFTGVNLISNARKKNAEDKLSVMCNAIRKDDSFLTSDIENKLLTEEDYASIDLREYYDADYPTYITKSTTASDTENIMIYTLNMYKNNNLSEIYATKSFEMIDKFDRNIYAVSFDVEKGVNRPLLSENMVAVGYDANTPVEDVYVDNWYDYTSKVTTFAKMKYNGENHIYVWIPRFAYSIQNFYDGTNAPDRIFSDVPASAMKIVFLRETSNYMSNNEVLPSEFKVHPAFSNENGEIPGFWISYETLGKVTSLTAAISNASHVSSEATEEFHLMSNSEYAASLYLMFALNDFEEIDFTSQNEYVMAGLESLAELEGQPYADKYMLDSSSQTGIKIKTGDAMVETNWDRITANYPTADKPCIVRLLKSNYFDFTSVSNGNYGYRTVIITK